ncbi:1-acyl-sn-glycerol-3-phosphate acyltransferase epsilon [Mactra antiquata]
MFLSVLQHLYSLRWTLPTAIMMGSSPTFITVWAAMRTLTIFLPERIYTQANDTMYDLYMRLILFFFHSYTGAVVSIYGNAEELLNESCKKNVIFICNHQCTVDWIVANMLASPQNSIGRIRFILKDGLRFFPLYGFYLHQRSCIYVRKNGKFDQEKASKELALLKDKNLPVWLVIFPEGTRMNPELPQTIEKSQEHAKEQGYEPFLHVLSPKVKGIQLALEQLRSHVESVYDVTIAYNNTIDSDTGHRLPAPGMLEILSLRRPEIHVHFDKIPVEDIPSDEIKLKHWMFTRFQQKDRLMSHFYSKLPEERGTFPGKSRTLDIPLTKTIPSFLLYSVGLLVLFSTPSGRSCYWKVSVIGTLTGCLWMSFR